MLITRQLWTDNELYRMGRANGRNCKSVQDHVQPEKRSGLRMIPTSHRTRWFQANARRNTAFLANGPWVAQHLESKVQNSTKKEDVWEECHDATLLACGVVYDAIVHCMPCFNNVA